MLSFLRAQFQYFRQLYIPSTFLQKKRCLMNIVIVKVKSCTLSNMSFVNERQQITRCHAQHVVVSLRISYIKKNQPLLYVFTEMLDKLITYIQYSVVCWYKTLYQVDPFAWTSITTGRYWMWLDNVTGETSYKVLYQHNVYVMDSVNTQGQIKSLATFIK